MHHDPQQPPSVNTGHRAPESSSFIDLISRQQQSLNDIMSTQAAASATTTTAPAASAPPPPPTLSGPPAGVGIVFKESRRNSTTALVVKSLAPGGPAATSALIQVGDILLKVDGKEVATTEMASKLILGERGTKISMVFKRFAQDKVDKFTVHLIRGTASSLNNQ